MDDIKKLVDLVVTSDAALTRAKTAVDAVEIDRNDPDWMAQAQSRSSEYRAAHQHLLHKISRALLDTFESRTAAERILIWDTLAETVTLCDYLDVPAEEAGFENELLLLIIKNLGSDPRDRLLLLNDLIIVEQKKNLQYRETVQRLLPLADDRDKYGMGSTRDLLQKALSTVL